MATEFVSMAAATAVVGYDIFSLNEDLRRRNFKRVFTALATAGSAAAGDTVFDIKVNGSKVGRFSNKATGWPTNDHRILVAIPVPANALVEAEITDAATTNPINVEVESMP